MPECQSARVPECQSARGYFSRFSIIFRLTILIRLHLCCAKYIQILYGNENELLVSNWCASQIYSWSGWLCRDNKELKQGHFEMGIRYANFMPTSNRCARKRATLCPLAKCYAQVHRLEVCSDMYNRGEKLRVKVINQMVRSKLFFRAKSSGLFLIVSHLKSLPR